VNHAVLLDPPVAEVDDREPAEASEGAPRLAPDAPRCRLGFALFLLVTAVLFVRPGELLPAVKDVPIYEPLMVGCLLASLPAILWQLRWPLLARQPASLCILGLLPAVVLSNLTHGDLWRARHGGLEFLKVLFYFLLLVGLVNTPSRLRTYLLVTAAFIVCTASLALLQHHGYLQIEALEAMEMREGYDGETGERVTTIRLQASGIFNDPNDFSLILTVGILTLTHLVIVGRGLLRRLLYAAPLGVLLYALALTHSRGGFLAMLAGTGVLLTARLGWRRAVPLGLVGLPLLLWAFAGRQTRIDLGDEGDTGHARVAIWRDGLQMFKASPVFGAGYGMMSRQLRVVAHNSFVHSYTELGFVGGTLFLGAFFVPLRLLRKRAVEGTAAVHEEEQPGDDPEPDEEAIVREELRQWRPCVLAVLAAYGVGLCSLSRAYTVTTYLILGTAAAYLTLLTACGASATTVPSGKSVRQLLVASVGFLVCLYVFVRVVA
jgi:hypothetical protein